MGHKELFATWIGVHLSALVHKPYKIMELMPLAVQLHQLVYKEMRQQILEYTCSMKQIIRQHNSNRSSACCHEVPSKVISIIINNVELHTLSLRKWMTFTCFSLCN